MLANGALQRPSAIEVFGCARRSAAALDDCQRLNMRSPYFVSYACFTCRRSFKRPGERPTPPERTCPHCGGPAHNLGRHFKAPAADDRAQWAKVRFLVEHGFPFQHVYDPAHGRRPVPYPETLKEARAFVQQYRHCALPRTTR